MVCLSRAAQLRKILKSEGRLTPKLAWPNLSFLATARGGTSDFYFQRFPTYFGDTPGWEQSTHRQKACLAFTTTSTTMAVSWRLRVAF